MFDFSRNDVRLYSLVGGSGRNRRAFYRQIVAFRRARREDDFFRRAAEKFGRLLARFFDSFARFPSEQMGRHGISEFLRKIRLHCGKNPRVKRGG
jgi:hypothetical protein